jgi:hypothetical protein
MKKGLKRMQKIEMKINNLIYRFSEEEFQNIGWLQQAQAHEEYG